MSGYETAYNLLMEMEMIYIEHEKHSIQILESPAPEIIVSKENKDRVSFEFTKSGGMNIFLSLSELTSFPTLTTSFSITTSTIPPLVSESGDPSALTSVFRA